MLIKSTKNWSNDPNYFNFFNHQFSDPILKWYLDMLQNDFVTDLRNVAKSPMLMTKWVVNFTFLISLNKNPPYKWDKTMTFEWATYINTIIISALIIFII